MKILAARSRVFARVAPPSVVRDRGGIGAVVFLIMALVFAPVVGLYVVCLFQPAGATAAPANG